MANEDAYYNINGQLTGIRFYNGTPYIGASADLSISLSSSSSAGILRKATYNSMTSSLSLSTSAGIVRFAQSQIAINSYQTTAAIEIRKLGSYPQITSNLTSNSIKIAKTSSSLSSSVSSDFSARKFKFAQANISIDSEIISDSHIAKKASSSISINSGYGVQLIKVYLASISLNSNLTTKVNDLIRFTPSARYPGSLVPLLSIDNKQLTEQNRKFDLSIKQVYIENKNWNNVKSRYYKRTDNGKMSFKISWEWLPNSKEATVDGRYARDYIKELSNDLDYHVLKVIEYGNNPGDIFDEQEYNVFITNYSEELIRRDLISGTYLWNCSLDLEQI